VHLRAGQNDEDFLPFAVTPRLGAPTARIALVLPAFSYLAYANEQMLNVGGLLAGSDPSYPSQPQDDYIVANGLRGLYDRHTDGSGVCYSSLLRPLVNMRPKYAAPWLDGNAGSPHQLNADLHIIDWLEHLGCEYDVLTDFELHRDGHRRLGEYAVVITGSHHEYWSGEMLDAAQRYLRAGGRMINLAGNGMYWVTQLDPDTGTSVEIRRRGPSQRNWEPEPGEAHLSSTGELGGIWRYRGHPPQSWLGVGFTAEGVSAGRGYTRQPDGFTPGAHFIFKGLEDDEEIGGFPCLVNGWGAAGFEIDRADLALGTPDHTLIVATAEGFTDDFQLCSEEVMVADSRQGGTVCPQVRADMTFLRYPDGGAVFSTGSISWSGCLSHNGYDNNVSRITRNVLERFVSPDPFDG
jgi:N,N-dimethylformamidase